MARAGRTPLSMMNVSSSSREAREEAVPRAGLEHFLVGAFICAGSLGVHDVISSYQPNEAREKPELQELVIKLRSCRQGGFE